MHEDNTDSTIYERMEQVEEFDLDTKINSVPTEDSLINNTEDIFNQISKEWGVYLNLTQARAEIEHKLPTIRELWQLLSDRPDKIPTKEVLFQRFQRNHADTGLHPPPLHV